MVKVSGIEIEEKKISNLNEPKLNFRESQDSDGIVTRRWNTPDGRKVIAIDSMNPNQAAVIRDKAIREERERIRNAIPQDFQQQRARAVVNENRASPRVYENPFGKSMHKARTELYDPLDEYKRLTSKKLPLNFNEDTSLEILLPNDGTKRVKNVKKG